MGLMEGRAQARGAESDGGGGHPYVALTPFWGPLLYQAWGRQGQRHT